LLAEREAEVLVVGADIGNALGAGRIRIKGNGGNTGRGRASIDLVIAATSATEIAMPSTFCIMRSWMICACVAGSCSTCALPGALRLESG
jgi:hypothetical protein